MKGGCTKMERRPLLTTTCVDALTSEIRSLKSLRIVNAKVVPLSQLTCRILATQEKTAKTALASGNLGRAKPD